MNKLTTILVLIASGLFAQTPQSRATMTTSTYWGQRVVPTVSVQNNVWASFYNKVNEPASGSGSVVLSGAPSFSSPSITGTVVASGPVVVGNGTNTGSPLTVTQTTANADILMGSTANSRLFWRNNTTGTSWQAGNSTTAGGQPVDTWYIGQTSGPDAAAISIRPSLDVQVQNRMKVGAITAPSATLDVGGTFSVNGTSTLGGMVTIQRGQDANVTNLSINSGTSNTNAFQYNTDQPNSNVILNARNNYNMVLAANDAEKVRLTTTVFSVTPTVLTSVGSISATAASTISAPVRIGSSTAPSASLDVDGTFSVSGTSTLGTILVMPEASTLTAGTTTGLKIGGATSQKLGFFNATPVVRQGATTDLGTTLSNLGFRASGSAYPITTSGTVALTGLVSSNTMDLGYVAKTANYTITTSDYLIDCTSGTFTVTLPTASSATAGKLFVVKNSGAGVITVQGNGAELIDAANTKALAVQYSLVAVMSTGTKWIIIYQI